MLIRDYSSLTRLFSEQDRHVPDYSTAKRLAHVLGLSVTFLYAEDDDLAEVIRV